MNNKTRKILFYTGALSIFIACGDDVTNINEQVGVQSFEDIKNFPNCTEENQGEMAIAKNEGLVYYCNDLKWKTLNGENGVDGKDGKNGDIGKTGDDGENGADGKSCTAVALDDNSGYKVICGEDSIGVVLNGAKGDKGEIGVDGKDGENGADGKSCTLKDNDDGTITINCVGESINITKAVCGKESYDPEIKFCLENILYDYCDGKTYNPATSYCYNNQLFSCRGKPYDSTKVECKDNDLVFTDERDKKKYRAITIGKQTWMAENLNYATVFVDDNNNVLADSGSYCYSDTIGNTNRGKVKCGKYGRLYSWASAMDSVNQGGCGYGTTCTPNIPHRGVCPKGWHLPTIAEWDELLSFIAIEKNRMYLTEYSYDVGLFLKAKDIWKEYREDEIFESNDFYNFSALPSGSRTKSGVYSSLLEQGNFWTSTEVDGQSAYELGLDHGDDGVINYSVDKGNAFSVRCILD